MIITKKSFLVHIIDLVLYGSHLACEALYDPNLTYEITTVYTRFNYEYFTTMSFLVRYSTSYWLHFMYMPLSDWYIMLSRIYI